MENKSSSTTAKLHANRQKEEILKNGDLYYPVQTVAKISRRAVSTYTTISPESTQEIQRCVKDFATLLGSEAGIQSMLEHPSNNVLRGEDVLAALVVLGYEEYAEILEIYLQKLRKGTVPEDMSEPMKGLSTNNNKKGKESKIKSKEVASSSSNNNNNSNIVPQSKKIKSTS